MYYRHLGCSNFPSGVCTSVSNFLEDLWFYIPSADTTIQALEFDPQQYIGGYKYSMSMQCDSVTGKWRFWNQATDSWATSTYTCGLLSQTNTWHHYQIYTTTNTSAHTYAFQTFVIDGVTVFSSLAQTYTATNVGFGNNIGIQQQVDNKSSSGTNAVYYDSYTFFAW
jgi:hypothetical protein